METPKIFTKYKLKISKGRKKKQNCGKWSEIELHKLPEIASLEIMTCTPEISGVDFEFHLAYWRGV